MDELKIYVKSSLIHKDPKQRAMPISECTHSHVNTTITIQLLSVAFKQYSTKTVKILSFTEISHVPNYSLKCTFIYI